MFEFNVTDNPEPYRLYLCKPSGGIIYELNGVDDSSASITLNLNNQYELSFDYIRYLSGYDGEQIESNGYHNLVIGMKILIDKIGYFRIKYPPYNYNGSIEKKSVTALSCECELEDKNLVDFNINMGTENSLEYLVTYDDDETEMLINEYTGLPYDYIMFYNTFPEQLQTILNKYNDGKYTDSSSISEIKTFCDLIPRLRNKVEKDSSGNLSLIEYVTYTYDSSGEKITSVCLSNFNNRVKQLITFYTKYRNQLSLLDLAIEKCNCNWTVGDVDKSLVNKKFQFSVNENIYAFLTNDLSSTAQCIFTFDLFEKKINVSLVEDIGEDSGVIIDKKNLLNSLEVSCDDENICTRYSVSGGNDISISYVNFGDTRIEDLTYFMNARDENGKRIYVSNELAEKYEQYIQDKDIARDTYISLTKQYNQLLIDIDDLKYKVPNDSVQNDWDTFTDKELDEELNVYNQLLVTLQSLYKEDYGTVGCNDDGSINEDYIKTTEYWYDYYAYKITIEQIEEAIKARASGIRYADITDDDIKKKINAYKTEWTLYGTIELENKITAYNNSMKVLVQGESVILKSNSEIAKQWSELSSDERTEYGKSEGIYQYDVYMNLYNERNSCQSYLNILNTKLKTLETSRDITQSNRNKLVKLVTVSGYDREELEKLITLPPSSIHGSFTDDEVKEINLLYIDGDYSNENILTTSLDNTVSEVDIQYELLNDAKEKLSIASQPQITFKAEIDNLLCMPEFKDFNFNIGNYTILEYYDDYYVKMRLSSMTFNPRIPNDSLSVSFTNYITSNSKRNDVSYILGQATGGGSSGGGSSSSGSTDGFGTSKDIDVTISNTMLAKLLNTEMFGTRVSNVILDTIKVNEINAKYAKFEGLAKGTTIIDGKCITTGYIVDQTYNGSNGSITNTTGSVINLENGKFNFAGGRLVFDGSSLKFGSDVTLSWGQVTGTDNVANKGDIPTTAQITQITKDTVTTSYVNALNVKAGSVDAENISGTTITGKVFSGCTGEFSGKVTASSGVLANWSIGTDCIYSTNSTFGDSNGMYFGSNGLSLGSYFKVNYNGTFNIANGKLVFDGNTLTLGSDVTLSWGQITDKDGVANKSDIPTTSQITQITKDTVTTSYVNALNITAGSVAAENISGTTITGKEFSGCTGDFSGNIKSTSGSIANWEIDYNCIYYNSSKFGNSGGIYFGTSGLSFSDTFKIYTNGTFNIANGSLVFDGRTLTLGSDVTLSWSQVTNKDSVASKSDIPTDVNQLNDASGQKWSTTVGNTWISTTSVTAQNLVVSSANISGLLTASQINTNGLIAENISADTLTGKTLSGCTGDFTGSIQALSLYVKNNLYLYDRDNGKYIRALFASIYYTDSSEIDDDKTSVVLGCMHTDDWSDTAHIAINNSTDTSTYNISIEGKRIKIDSYSSPLYIGNEMRVMGRMSVGSNQIGYYDSNTLYNGILFSPLTSNVNIGNDSYVLNLYTSSNVYKNGSLTTYFATTSSSSDGRLKEYVSDITPFENFFMNLSPVSFKFHDGLYNIGDVEPTIKWGFYAQDIIDDFTKNGLDWHDYDLVLEEDTDISEEERKYLDDSYKGVLRVNYQNFTALNTHMIQKLYKEILELKQEIIKLKKG